SGKNGINPAECCHLIFLLLPVVEYHGDTGMNDRCPKCGSNEILNDECLKCGVIISKAHASSSPPESDGVKPVSYVSPTFQPPAAPTSYTWKPPTMQSPQPVGRSEWKRIQRSVVLSILSLLTLAGVYHIYRYFVHQASAYGGYYRNTYHFF